MAIFECPGALKFKRPQPEVIKCPSCSYEVEIWTDEAMARCPECGTEVMREPGQSCLDWCKYAKECVGDEAYKRHIKNRFMSVKDRLIEELKIYFGDDKKRITHAMKVMHLAEELLKKERGDFHIVIPASILHDVGIKISERKYGTEDGHLQEREGPSVAKKILLKVGLRREDIDEICEIIAHHHSPGRVNTINFKILYDADQIVNLREKMEGKTRDELMHMIENTFLTDSGKEMAKDMCGSRVK